MPQLSSGDWIALAMFFLAAAGMGIREWHASNTAKLKAATDGVLMKQGFDSMGEKIGELFEALKDLETKRQKHEVDCARIHERTAAMLERITERLDKGERTIGQLQSQMSHVASGGAGRVIEILPTKDAG